MGKWFALLLVMVLGSAAYAQDVAAEEGSPSILYDCPCKKGKDTGKGK